MQAWVSGGDLPFSQIGYLTNNDKLQPNTFIGETVFNDSGSYNIDKWTGRSEPPRSLRGEVLINDSEERLNEFLFNFTISTLKLSAWHTMAEVNETYFVTVYRFSQPKQFYIPYTLCIGMTGAILTLGLLSLRANGVAATDGGFLQVFMTTTGDTEMRKAAVTSCLGGRRNASEELLEMKVRFGELPSEKGTARRAGFGTVEETVPLVKRVAYGYDLAE